MLHFSHDDLDAAQGRARAAKKAVLIDAWAPWCHTCLSMQSFVLNDPALGRFASQIEAVALDTDRPENAGFLEQYAISAWPTFLVIDPENGEVFGYWPGSATLDETASFLEEAVSALAAARGGSAIPGSDGDLVRGHAALARRDAKEAATAYARAAASLKPHEPRRSEALIGWIRALYADKNWAECARIGRDYLAEVEGGATPADFSYYALTCAEALPEGADRAKTLEIAIKRLQELARNPPPGAAIDDRSDTYGILADARKSAGDEAGARRANEARIELLEAAARSATSVEAASTFDYQRSLAYLALGRGDDAVKMLRARAEQRPDSYEPVARLADVLHELHRDDQALTAIERAIALSYGPRRLRYVSTRADILKALGRFDDELAALRELVRGYEGLARGHANEAKLAAARKKLAEAEARPRKP